MKRLSTILLFLGSFAVSDAQYLWDYGIQLGGANYLGDIGGVDQSRRDFIFDMRVGDTRYVAGAYIRRRISRSFNVKLSASYARIQGNDERTTDYAPRRARNLNFTNNIKELALQTEFTLYTDNDFGGRGLYNPNFRVYGTAGVAGFLHNPRGTYVGSDPDFQGMTADLRPLRTEGQAEEYKSWGISVPMGFGFYFTYNRKLRLGWEIGHRLTFTDYIDDISTVYATDAELDNDAMRIAFANQTTPEVIASSFPGEPSQIWNYDYPANYSPDSKRNPRGIEANSDGYVYMTLSAGLIIQKKSSSFKAKKRRYGWLKGKVKKKRKTRAKF
ncbi:MAG: DUF6089 family protein [Bacteroidota bacterium]